MTELRTEIIDGETWTEHPMTYWCQGCQAWRHPATETMPEAAGQLCTPRCWTCGDDAQCDTCGAPLETTLQSGADLACTEDPEH